MTEEEYEKWKTGEIKEIDDYEYEDWFNDEYAEHDTTYFTTPSHDKIVILCKYGNDY